MTREELITAIGKVEGERARLLAQLIATELRHEPDDALLTVTDAAQILSVTTDWLYRHADDLPFTVRPGPGQVRFSKRGIQEYLRRQRR
mgnify:CR=1 FL=1